MHINTIRYARSIKILLISNDPPDDMARIALLVCESGRAFIISLKPEGICSVEKKVLQSYDIGIIT